jgi:GntR family transcriptional regulator, arabinose operon transcriptional repressor
MARRPLYRAVADTLRRQLADGGLSPGAKLPTVRKLAARFGVSVVTVGKALRTLQREGQVTCIPAVGAFVPAATAAQAASTQVTIAFATVALEDALTSWIAAGIEEACRHRGWFVQIHNARTDPKNEAETLNRLPNSNTKGAIVLPLSDDANIEALFYLKFSKFPFVLVDRRIPGLRVDVVESDQEMGGYLATRYLLEHGHRRVFMYTSPPYCFTSADARARGYERALVERGIEPRPEWKITCDCDVEGRKRDANAGPPWIGWYEGILPILPKIDLPAAFFVMSAYSGRGLLTACRDLGLRVPQDISVVCFDDTEFMEAFDPPVTVIAQRRRQIGQAAVELLERRLASGGNGDPQSVPIDVDLIERESVCSPEERERGRAKKKTPDPSARGPDQLGHVLCGACD